MLGDGARPRRPGGGRPGLTAPGVVSGIPGAVCAAVSAWRPVGAEHNAVGLGLAATGAVPSADLSGQGAAAALGSGFVAPGVAAVPGAALGALGMAEMPGVVGDRLEGGAAPSPTSGSIGAPGVGGGIPAGRTIASSCPLVNLMP